MEMDLFEPGPMQGKLITGGELGAMVVIDAVTRLIPGVLGSDESVREESFSDGRTLEYPQYTRPESFEGEQVPEVLLSGDHDAIRRWRMQQSLGRTMLRRPDLLAAARLDGEQRGGRATRPTARVGARQAAPKPAS